MQSTSYQCVGGPHDGKMIAVPEGTTEFKVLSMIMRDGKPEYVNHRYVLRGLHTAFHFEGGEL